MKKKGFTLVELLAVIVLLSGLLLLVTTNIIGVVQKTNTQLDESTRKLLYSAAEIYLDKKSDLKNGDYVVSVNEMISANIINETILSAQQEKKITKNSCVKVNITNGIKNYEFQYDCSSELSLEE